MGMAVQIKLSPGIRIFDEGSILPFSPENLVVEQSFICFDLGSTDVG